MATTEILIVMDSRRDLGANHIPAKMTIKATEPLMATRSHCSAILCSTETFDKKNAELSSHIVAAQSRKNTNVLLYKILILNKQGLLFPQ